MSGCPREADRRSGRVTRAVTRAGPLAAPPLCPGLLCLVSQVRWSVEEIWPLDGRGQKAQRPRSPQGGPGVRGGGKARSLTLLPP